MATKTVSKGLSYYTDDQVLGYLEWDELLPAIERALKQYSRHEFAIVQPVRTSFAIPQHSSLFYAMPCFYEFDDILCTKLLAVNPNNVPKCIPTFHAIIQLFRGSTGKPLAILDGEVITNWRTAAVSAVATKLLVKGTPKILSILGAGHQARSHFQALNHLYDFTEIRVWNIRPRSARQLMDEIERASRKGILCTTVKEAVQDADVICTVTNANEPFLEAEWIKPGAHINAVGASRFDRQEIHPDLMKKAVVYVECMRAALQESGDIIKSKVNIYGEIGEVLDGKKEALKEEITLFKSLGMACEDAATAGLVYRKIEASSDK